MGCSLLTSSGWLQSVGKSTFMEAITKRPIFPQGPGATTRAPVVLHLEHVQPGAAEHISVTFRGTAVPLGNDASIPATVTSSMQQVPADELTAEEIVVRIRKPGLPSITLIDTPGISDQLPSSYDIARAYLQSDSTLVICVVDAGYIDLAPHQAVTLVKQAGKLHDAVLVLTRTDEVTIAKAIQERVLDRVLGRSQEMQRTGFSRAYAVIPKLSRDAADAGGSEQDVFQRQFLQLLPSLGPEYEGSQAAVKAHVSMASLISGIVPWFEGFVRRRWIHSIMPLRPCNSRKADRGVCGGGEEGGSRLQFELLRLVEDAFVKLQFAELPRQYGHLQHQFCLLRSRLNVLVLIG